MDAVWRKVPAAELEAHFNPRAAVPDAEDHLARAARRAAEARGELAGRTRRDVRYGDGPKQVLDIVAPESGAGAPVVLFLHGGYWRALDKDDHSHLALPFGDAVFVNANYDLCPDASLDDLVREAREAVLWTAAQVPEARGPGRLFLYGHSAGAHLAAAALGEGLEGLDPAVLGGLFAVSGIYEPEVACHLTVNAEIGLDPETARRNDVLLRETRHRPPALVAVGGAEPGGWVAQSRAYADLLRGRGVEVEYVEAPGFHHFTFLEGLADPGDPLVRRMRARMGLPPAYAPSSSGTPRR